MIFLSKLIFLKFSTNKINTVDAERTFADRNVRMYMIHHKMFSNVYMIINWFPCCQFDLSGLLHFSFREGEMQKAMWLSQLESDPPHLINTQLFMWSALLAKLSVLLF